MSILDGKVAIVTGAGKGLGRSEAIDLAKQGATVLVNDIEPCKNDVDEVIETINSFGGKAFPALCDVGDFSAVGGIIGNAINEHGGLDIVVNNAGILRDKMIFNMNEEEFDLVVKVHLKGHFNFIQQACAYWKNKSKTEGNPVFGRLVSTSSEAFLYCSPGQPNYSSAKAGITALTMAAAQGMIRYGVTANVICPRARTEMTQDSFPPADPDFDIFSPDNVASVVSYLSSPASQNISGYVFIVWGNMVRIVDGPTMGAKLETKGQWSMETLTEKLGSHFSNLKPILDGFAVIPSE